MGYLSTEQLKRLPTHRLVAYKRKYYPREEYDWDKNERGNLVYQAGGLGDHHKICRCLISNGKFSNDDEEDE